MQHYHLVGYQKHSLQVELTFASLEHIFQTWSKHVHDHHMQNVVLSL